MILKGDTHLFYYLKRYSTNRIFIN